MFSARAIMLSSFHYHGDGLRHLIRTPLHTMNGSVEWMKVNALCEVTATHTSFAHVPEDR